MDPHVIREGRDLAAERLQRDPLAESDAGPAPLIREVGLSAMLVTFSDRLSDAANRSALAFRRAVDEAGHPGIDETATSLTSVFVSYDPVSTGIGDLRAWLADLLASRDWARADLPSGRLRWRIPCAFGGNEGPQLAEAAHLAGLSETDAVAEIAASPLRVLTIGFAPGMPYLGALPERWQMPRQEKLTRQVPAGAVVTAIRQLALFTNATPTGWRQIGLTAFRPFRLEEAEPFALRPGDEVQLVPADARTIARLRAAPDPGDGGADCEVLE